MSIFLICCVGWCHEGLAADAQDDSLTSTAQRALTLAYENELRIGTVDRALFHQQFSGNNERPSLEFALEFGWDTERRFQQVGATDHRVHDGVSTTSLLVSESRSYMTIRNDAHDALHGWPEWILNDMFPLRQHWWARETESRPPSEFESLGSQIIDGVRCFAFAGIGSTFYNRPQCERIWVDSSGHVRRLEEYLGSFGPNTPPTQAIENGELYRRITYREYHEYGQVNVPTIMQIEGFGEYAGRTITTDLVDFQPEFAAETFVISIPDGTEVYDHTREPPEFYTYPAEQMSKADLQERRSQIAQELALQRQAEEWQRKLIGTKAPELSIDKWLNGDAHSLSGLKGKWVLLDFKSIACGPCVDTIPVLNKLIAEFKDKPVQVVGVHTHVPAKFYRDIERYIGEHEIKYVIGVSSEDSNFPWGTVFSAYGVRAIPDSVLIDPDGQIVSIDDVWSTLAQLRKEYYWVDAAQGEELEGEQ